VVAGFESGFGSVDAEFSNGYDTGNGEFPAVGNADGVGFEGTAE